MTDEVLKELWATKDKIAEEHRYNVDELAEYFLQKQSSRRGRFHYKEGDLKAQSGKDGCLTRPPHTTEHAGPHEAVHQKGAHEDFRYSHARSSTDREC